MAQTTQDSTVFSDSTGQELKEQAVESKRGEVEVVVAGQTDEGTPSTPPVARTDAHVEKATSQTSPDAQLTEPPPRPSLTPLGSTHTQSSTLTPVAPHPKRFNAVNINKKFLEKNTASGSAAASATSSTSKSGTPSTRPSAPPTSSHSRLVTAKLTASPAVTSAAGWSRPSSVAPSTAGTSSPISTSPLPTTPATQLSTTSAPQLPHAGKVILPQPRAAMTQLVSSQKEPTAPKPVWGNVKPPTATSTRPDIQTGDFPTAAEVAHNSLLNSTYKQAKADEAKATSDTAKQLRSEEADTFRGVHLDPNAHHWDEEEDDDNFLDVVIEFGDGRQYKIESNEQAGPSGSQGPRPQTGDSSAPSGPVSKEERFVDDFDRSWPKSRTSPPTATRDFPSPAPQPASLNVSPVISHATHSSQDSSRVLFNERSNRLEPYSQSHRPTFGAKRPGYQDATSPVESRHAPHNVQVLQKTVSAEARSRRFSSSNNAGPANGFAGDRNHRRDVPPQSPRMTRDLPPHTVDRDWDFDRGRRSSMGPPPIPSHAMKQEGGRQLPPHLSQVSPNIPARRLSSRDSRFSPSEPSASLPPSGSGHFPPHSPAVSHSSLSIVSPAAASNIPLPLSAPELDEVRKDVMHTAAERAKQRRQQEEAEREAQKERARRKAAEIEEKMKAIEAEKQKVKEPEDADKLAKDKEAISFIEAAIKSVELAPSSDEKKADSTPPDRPPPLKISPVHPVAEPPHSAASTRGAVPSRNVPPTTPTPIAQAPSWRARTTLPPPTARQIQARPSAATHFIPSTPSAAEQVETIAGESKDELEVVDFSDMGKFVGVHEATASALGQVPEETPELIASSKPSRAVASDFFDEPPQVQDTVPESKKAEFGAWRRKVSQDINEPSTAWTTTEVKAEVRDNVKKVVSQVQVVVSSQDHSEHVKEPLESSAASVDILATPKEQIDQSLGSQPAQPSPNSHLQRTPRAQTFYKEPNMSALDDAMSRIKGALVGMHAHEPVKEIVLNNVPTQETQPQCPAQSVLPPAPQTPVRAPKDRWVPPALRPRRFDEHDEPREVFLYTVLQPPSSLGSLPAVKLPAISRPVDFINKKQLNSFFKPPYQARMDILSFDPPVPDMNRRDWSLNDVLFRKPPVAFKAKFRYLVVLPRFRGPKVSIPNSNSSKLNGSGAFGRPTVADGASTWRKPAPSPAVKSDFASDVSGLDTTSRSPPPDHTPPESAVASIPKASESSPSKSDTNSLTRSRSQPKMPEGSAVAFIRDSRIDVVEADTKPLVNFIVGSQLEETSPASEVSTPIITNEPSKPAVNGFNPTTSNNKEHVSGSIPNNDELISTEDSTDQILVTPPTHHSSASWTRSSISLTAKDSPARAPDPEHLKAVWSQSSNKAGLHAVNSLEGIADDLTALPFTLQDVKSEDGETPPPSLPTAPSRMSLHDVTRAFQTVPTSSSVSSQPPHRATFSPPSTQAPVARPTPTTSAYPYSPVSQNNIRPPTFVSYPSPMMSHSPAPVMYGHPMPSSPVPSRMQVNGHTPLYSQPMWVTMPPAQTHGNMMRPVPSPYPAQMMGYASPGYAPQPPNMMPMSPTTQNGGRGRGMPMMSPVMSHAHAHPGPPMYGGSPVMLHAVQVPQNHGYMPVAPLRGQPRTETGQMPGQQQHVVHHPPSHGGFNAGPTSSFRTQW